MILFAAKHRYRSAESGVRFCRARIAREKAHHLGWTPEFYLAPPFCRPALRDAAYASDARWYVSRALTRSARSPPALGEPGHSTAATSR